MTTIANFVRVKLYADITAGATEIRFDPAEAPFNAPPNPAGRLAYAVLLDDPRAPTAFELISYTKMEFNRLRGVTRGVDGTTALAWTKGAIIAQDIPAALAEPLGLEGVAGDVLRVGLDGKLAVGAIRWSELAGVVNRKAVLVLDVLSLAQTPAAPPAGEAILYCVDNSGSDTLAIRFSTSNEPIVSDF